MLGTVLDNGSHMQDKVGVLAVPRKGILTYTDFHYCNKSPKVTYIREGFSGLNNFVTISVQLIQ